MYKVSRRRNINIVSSFGAQVNGSERLPAGVISHGSVGTTPDELLLDGGVFNSHFQPCQCEYLWRHISDNNGDYSRKYQAACIFRRKVNMVIDSDKTWAGIVTMRMVNTYYKKMGEKEGKNGIVSCRISNKIISP